MYLGIYNKFSPAFEPIFEYFGINGTLSLCWYVMCTQTGVKVYYPQIVTCTCANVHSLLISLEDCLDHVSGRNLVLWKVGSLIVCTSSIYFFLTKFGHVKTPPHMHPFQLCTIVKHLIFEHTFDLGDCDAYEVLLFIVSPLQSLWLI